jgi:hypothetical protein
MSPQPSQQHGDSYWYAQPGRTLGDMVLGGHVGFGDQMQGAMGQIAGINAANAKAMQAQQQMQAQQEMAKLQAQGGQNQTNAQYGWAPGGTPYDGKSYASQALQSSARVNEMDNLKQHGYDPYMAYGASGMPMAKLAAAGPLLNQIFQGVGAVMGRRY